MEESRLNIISKKSLLILGNGIDVEAGEFGQLEADIEIEGVKIVSEELEDDLKMYQIRVVTLHNISTNRRRRP